MDRKTAVSGQQITALVSAPRRVPRYRTAPCDAEMSPLVGDAAFRATVARSNNALIPANLALYLHMPFCESLCLHCTCHTELLSRRSTADRYAQAVIDEIEAKASLFDEDRRVTSLLVGGGTPLTIGLALLSQLIESVNAHFQMSDRPRPEMTIQVDSRISPVRDYDDLVRLGFSRAQMTVISEGRGTQQCINRKQPYEVVARHIATARECGFDEVDVVLRYGLPGEQPASLRLSLLKLIDMSPEAIRLVAEDYAPSAYPRQRLMPRALLPSASIQAESFLAMQQTLERAGYCYLGLDQFVLPGSAMH